mgnify:CR=1 FL=1
MRLIIVLFLWAFASLAQATPGGLDANGCHNSKKKDFHCHVARDKSPAKTQGRAETGPQREKRLLRECQGRPNSGACLGYAKGPAEPAR